ncbi:hypothetical protein P280DRAFT_482839 [Massarina eburnea CBS 473.64]|uniref:Uncharacterized protein n=1 Tax=Massarina eburnea CBS 473.64 TaxID=1395130 RepID=A0A6A6RPU6_9PLEO|nr:hypothetical protein P280DRAFT_482839 [Massarina eburnea CBS 473.64]
MAAPLRMSAQSVLEVTTYHRLEWCINKIYNGSIGDEDFHYFLLWLHNRQENLALARRYIRELKVDTGYNTARIKALTLRLLMENTESIRDSFRHSVDSSLTESVFEMLLKTDTETREPKDNKLNAIAPPEYLPSIDIVQAADTAHATNPSIYPAAASSPRSSKSFFHHEFWRSKGKHQNEPKADKPKYIARKAGNPNIPKYKKADEGESSSSKDTNKRWKPHNLRLSCVLKEEIDSRGALEAKTPDHLPPKSLHRPEPLIIKSRATPYGPCTPRLDRHNEASSPNDTALNSTSTKSLDGKIVGYDDPHLNTPENLSKIDAYVAFGRPSNPLPPSPSSTRYRQSLGYRGCDEAGHNNHGINER